MNLPPPIMPPDWWRWRHPEWVDNHEEDRQGERHTDSQQCLWAMCREMGRWLQKRMNGKEWKP